MTGRAVPKAPRAIAKIKLLVRLRLVPPVVDGIHQQQTIQIATQHPGEQTLLHDVHGLDDPQAKDVGVLVQAATQS